MSLSRTRRARTLKFKILLLYGSLYMASILFFMGISFYVFYKSSDSSEIKTIYDEIAEIDKSAKGKQFQDFLNILSGEINDIGSSNLIIHFNADGKEYYLPSRELWKPYLHRNIHWKDIDAGRIERIRNNKTGDILKLAGARLHNGIELHVGYISDTVETLKKNFLDIFEMIFIPILIAGCGIGYVMTQKTLGEISAVKDTAMEIYRGNLESRVERSFNGDEIDQLSEAFNLMLSRIQRLIAGMSAIVDNIAHDLRSPLTRMKGSIEVALLYDKAGKDQGAILGNSLAEFERMIAMVNDILNISEAESGVTHLKREAVMAREFLESLCEFYQPLAAESGIDLSLGEVQSVRFDADRLKLWRVLANLLDNALKFTPRGGTITLGATGTPEGVRLLVADTGEGIAEEDIGNIFKKFYKADKGRSSKGYGLGLSYVKAVVELHGGGIEVQSDPGRGTRFVILLPRAPAPLRA